MKKVGGDANHNDPGPEHGHVAPQLLQGRRLVWLLHEHSRKHPCFGLNPSFVLLFWSDASICFVAVSSEDYYRGFGVLGSSFRASKGATLARASGFPPSVSHVCDLFLWNNALLPRLSLIFVISFFSSHEALKMWVKFVFLVFFFFFRMIRGAQITILTELKWQLEYAI